LKRLFLLRLCLAAISFLIPLSCQAYSRIEYDQGLSVSIKGPREFRLIRLDTRKEVLLLKIDKENKPVLSSFDGKELGNLTLTTARKKWGTAFPSDSTTQPSPFYFVFDTLEGRLVRFWVFPNKNGLLTSYFLKIDDFGTTGGQF